MSCNNSKKIFKNDAGIIFRVFAGVDLTTATSVIMKVKSPNGTSYSWTATKAGDNNFYAVYTTTSTDLNEVGTWLMSLYVTFPAGVLTGATDYFEVYNQFEDIV